MAAPEVDALRALVDRIVTSGNASRELSTLRSDVAAVLGEIDSRLGDGDLVAQAGAISAARDSAIARENAAIREELVRRGVSTDELDQAGIASSDDLDAAAQDGTLADDLAEGRIRTDIHVGGD